MRIAYIAAGAAGSYCGACTRDVALVRGLTERGHQVIVIPLYTPLRTDGPDPAIDRVFYGGINAYLQQRSRFFRKTPGFVDWFLDRPFFLRLVSRFAIETRPEQLGDMTVSVLRGAAGRQRKEADKLLDFLERDARPDIVNITNSLLSALAPEIKRRLRVPVVCTLQGEDSFISRLPASDSETAVKLIQQHARSMEALISPGERYADRMSELLAFPRDRIRVIRPGVEHEQYAGTPTRPGESFRIGFLSRVSPDKGADILVDAFILLERERPGRAALHLAGEARGPNEKFLADLRARLAGEGLADRFEYHGELDLDAKIRFLRDCTVFSLPSRYPEQRAMACLEAMAAGLPIVAPNTGLFPELVDLTRGGLLVPPEDSQALAGALRQLLDDAEQTRQMGRAAVDGVARHFSAEEMTAGTLALYEELVDAATRPAAVGDGRTGGHAV